MNDTGDPKVEQLLGEARARPSSSLPPRERNAELLLGVLLLAAVAALATLAPSARPLTLAGAAGLIALHSLAQRVRFDVGAGYTAPTQLVLVPMLLIAPPAAVPIMVALGCVVARLPGYLRREVHITRMAFALPDGWHAMGAAIVISALAPGGPALRHWPIYLLALAAQLVFDVGSSTLREWLANGASPKLHVRLLGWVALVDVLLAPAGLLAALAGARQPVAIALVLPTVGLIAVFARERRSRIDHALALSHAYRGTAMLMSELLTASDDYTGGEHSHGVVALALAVGDELGMDGRERRDLEFAALLHDVGKIHVPDAILNKPGRLTDDEFEVIKRHPADGQQMLERIGGVLANVGVIVRHHHERWDGRGYPDAIAGDDIPLPARIICACDAFSAMTTDRSYRRAMPVSEALGSCASARAASSTPRS